MGGIMKFSGYRQNRGIFLVRYCALAYIVVAATVILSGCDNNIEEPIPESVQSIIPKNLVGDGEFQYSSIGRFQVLPDTLFCTFRPGYGLNGAIVDEEMSKAGKSINFPGGPLRINADAGEERCSPVKSIYVRGFVSENRSGKPYKLVLVLWQGRAAWAGVVERSDGERPGVEGRSTEAMLIDGSNRRRIAEASISLDLDDLTRQSLRHILKD
jgi:hypothetical protein